MANSATKFLQRLGAGFTEVFAVISSAGAADANKIPTLNANGLLDMTMMNAKSVSAGGGDAGKLVALDGTGKIDGSMLPAAAAEDKQAMTASEALAAGDYVNIFEQTAGVFRVRKADASTFGKHAMGYVKAAAVANAADGAMVYFEGKNDVVSGQTAGDVFLSATTPGLGTSVAPSGNNQVVQRIGFATTATSVNFDAGDPIRIAA